MRTAEERVSDKISKIVAQCGDDVELLDDRIEDELDIQEILTVGLMPINSKIRNFVFGCCLRSRERRKKVEQLKRTVKEEELVPVEVHGGGKCKMTVFMTKEAADRERGR
ncbi:MAG: hypothetical protein CBC12_05150 [Candidatus Puniceispirillum sp. TMED52]|nr:MAG: hypothetical protein CBC12_05150 [Candidatus Puniceispirillum sp. TMED52]RPF82221.1 MAG: hypothetical protein CBC65_000580 [Rhodothermaceae bacterium TMED105]|tara:strand:+ start:4262 stop:4591 length:330 start_codon:yes stop_codon:yes gene_type:complete